jgi:hypothetical protein
MKRDTRPKASRARNSDIFKAREIRITVFYPGPMILRASNNQNVSHRQREAGSTSAACEIKRARPNCLVDGKLRQHSFKLSEHFFLTVAACPVP